MAREERRKALPLEQEQEQEQAAILQPDELESLVPPASRDIHLCRFVPAGLVTAHRRPALPGMIPAPLTPWPENSARS